MQGRQSPRPVVLAYMSAQTAEAVLAWGFLGMLSSLYCTISALTWRGVRGELAEV